MNTSNIVTPRLRNTTVKILLANLVACAFASVIALAQTGVADGQQRAIAKYPELAIANSPLNATFLALVQQAQQQEPTLFTNPDWPLVVADRAHSVIQARVREEAAAKENAALEEISDTVKGAEGGNAQAQYDFGLWYYRRKNYGDAAKWFQNAANKGHLEAQFTFGRMLETGRGVPKEISEALKWYFKAAEGGFSIAQNNLGSMYRFGEGVSKDYDKSMKWYLKSAAQGNATAQFNIGAMHERGDGVPRDSIEAVKWYRRAAEQGHEFAQNNLGAMYADGIGLPKSRVDAYKWFNLAAANGHANARRNLVEIEKDLTSNEIAEAQRLTRAFRPRLESSQPPNAEGPIDGAGALPSASGTGFFLTADGYIVTNFHVIKDARRLRVRTNTGEFSAQVVKQDVSNDLALLKVEGSFFALAIISSSDVKLGATVATVGFPNPQLQGFAPKLAKGEIASLSGIKDDPHNFQVSVPLQPGNSGGPLVNEMGNVVGVVVAKLSQKAALATTGELAENVNYAVKSSYLLSLLESTPTIKDKLKAPDVRQRKFETVVQDVEKAAVLILVY